MILFLEIDILFQLSPRPRLYYPQSLGSVILSVCCSSHDNAEKDHESGGDLMLNVRMNHFQLGDSP